MRLGIIGGGVAAATCAHLADAAGFSVVWDRQDRPLVPTVLLSDAALGLMRDVFGRADLFSEKARVTRRIVKWGPGDPVSLPHGGVLVSEADLERELARPQAQVQTQAQVGDSLRNNGPVDWMKGQAGAGGDQALPADFTVFTAKPLPQDNAASFGQRQAAAVPVVLHGLDAMGECRIESLPSGWLFLVPETLGKGWLLGFGAPLAQLLADSTLVAPVVALDGDVTRSFDTAPRLALPLAGEGWLACGTAALRFDPICGDGTAQAVREALLASAVIKAISQGENPHGLILHYRSMLVAAMRRHLKMCAQFYAGGGQSPWWHEQCSALVQGYDRMTDLLAGMPEPRYALNGADLMPRGLAA